jgi:ribosomal protein S10
MEPNVSQPADLPRQALVDIVEHLQHHLFLDIAGRDDLFVKGAEFWNPDKSWDVELLESLADKLAEYGLRPEQAMLRAQVESEDAEVVSFVKRYSIQDVLSWEIYKNRLRHMLVDITAEDDECPEAIKRSDWEGDIEIDGEDLVVTLHAGSLVES